MLSPYRVLDLTDDRGQLCGQILGDLGADVIQVEPPGGSPARKLGPFFHDEPHPDRSIFWWAYNRNKRSVTLDLASAEGRALFDRLIERADFLLESDDPGVLAARGLSYTDLSARNPALIYVSISAFGQDGPKANYAASDLTLMAASGVMIQTGDHDRAPLRLCVPQAFLHACADGAVSTLIAHHERVRSGRGQHVDVSAQQSTALATQFGILAAPLRADSWHRLAGGLKVGPLEVPLVWTVADGHIALGALFGKALGPFTAHLMRYIYDQGGCEAALRDTDWIGYGDLLFGGKEPVANFERLNGVIAEFVATRTKAELFKAALEHNLLLAPVTTMDEVMASPQFAAREYWRDVEHPELGRPLRYPGPFAKFGATPIRYRRRPPLVGEHNREIYADELGLSPQRLAELARTGII
jgi:crotonobetainyl-CoA:carnitine CoA-transferase CaiB-like acyl-CoA transferase